MKETVSIWGRGFLHNTNTSNKISCFYSNEDESRVSLKNLDIFKALRIYNNNGIIVNPRSFKLFASQIENPQHSIVKSIRGKLRGQKI